MKKIKWYQTLALRFSAVFILIIFVITAMAGIAEFIQDKQALHEELKTTGLLLALNLAHSLSDDIIYEDHWHIHKELKMIVKGIDKGEKNTQKIYPVSYAEIKDKDEKPLVTFDPQDILPRLKRAPLFSENDSSGNLLGRSDNSIYFIRSKDESFYEVTVPILYINQKVGRLRLGLTTRYVDLTLDKMKIKIFSIAGVACLSAIVLFLFLFRNISSSIEKLSDVSLSIANGNFKERSTYTHKDEIGVLAFTFNHMAQRLETFTQDIEKKNEDLKKKNTELESFASTISHDLKNPLVTIEGFVSLLMDEVKEKLSTKEFFYLERIKKNTKFMERLISSILDLCRAERPHEDLQDVALLDITQKVINNYQFKLKDKQIKIFFPEQMAVVSYHPNRLYEIFSNLVSNAIKFMKEQGNNEITIEEKKREGFLQIMVRDNGIGIDKKYYEKIFEPFDRLDTSKDIEGTGVGLAIVKKIVENYGGKVWVESKPDIGTVFYFTIPVKTGEEKI